MSFYHERYCGKNQGSNAQRKRQPLRVCSRRNAYLPDISFFPADILSVGCHEDCYQDDGQRKDEERQQHDDNFQRGIHLDASFSSSRILMTIFNSSSVKDRIAFFARIFNDSMSDIAFSIVAIPLSCIFLSTVEAV